MTRNTTISRASVTHGAQSYVVSTIHAAGANYYETCLFGANRPSKVLDEYATEDAAHSGHQRWVARIAQHGWPPDTECQECGAAITDGADANATVSTQHATNCSMHPDNIVDLNPTSQEKPR
jgi:hypothetical protein